MSYSEQGGQVVLTMSREDYDSLMIALGTVTGMALRDGIDTENCMAFLNRINQGNPNYTPYQVTDTPNAPRD